MKGAWLVLIPERNQIWLQVGSQCCWLHSKNDIHPNIAPEEAGWKSDKLSIDLRESHAQHILFEWLMNGPMDFSLGEQTLMRLPDAVREVISYYERNFSKAS